MKISIAVWICYTILATVFAVLWFASPRIKIIEKPIPASGLSKPDSVAPFLLITQGPLKGLSATGERYGIYNADKKPVVDFPATIDSTEETVPEVEPQISYLTEYHPTFLGEIRSFSQAIGPCKVDLMGTTLTWRDGEKTVKENFKKQIVAELKIQQSDRFKTGVILGVVGTIIAVGGIALLIK